MLTKVSTHHFSEVTSESADEDCIDGDPEEGVDQADPAPHLRIKRDPAVADGLKIQG